MLKTFVLFILFKIQFTNAVLCSYWDPYRNAYLSTYCSQTCCMNAGSLEEACCYGIVWWIALLSIGFPILVGAIIILLLYYLIRKRRHIYSSRNATASTITMPPVYSTFASGRMIQNRPLTTLSSDNLSSSPPSYNSVVKITNEQASTNRQSTQAQVINETSLNNNK